ncbi:MULTISPECIES: gliding motility-associated C-terminal domain-containing protein [Flavobacterium]|uniref:HYR-like domain-containing protein n=1 Tax=Flavobacterium TaxID=237 RepID=UPI0021157550|nr:MULTISPECIES: gliding motility-associated C-terminal domain-containing protein [Flavobacterium]UUF13898.1 gliding motility-associated C-terminal domain-containing protein [Flavobacterium panici]
MKKTLLSFKFTKKINKAFYLLLFLLFSIIGFAQTITPTKIVTVAPGVCGALDVELKIQGSNPVARPLEVVLVIDVSGSMGDGNNPKPLSRAQDAAIDFINKMFLPANNTTNKNRVAIVTYSTTASIRRNLTLASGQADLISVINGLSANGSTNIQDGLVKAKTVLDGATYDCATARSIVLLTDGVANATGTNGSSCSDGQQGTCIQSAITAATAAKTVTVSGTSYNNQIFSVGLFGAISGSEQTNAQYALNQIQSGGSFFTENAADLTGIYGQIFTQLSWVAKQIPSTAFEKETVDSNFIIGTVTPSKGTVTIVGQQINWNIDFLNVETITLKYRLTPKPNTCGNQLVSTSRLDFQNAACVTTFQNINSPTTNVPCPVITLASQTNVTCFGGNNGAITLNTPTGGQAPYTYKWTKNNVDFATTKDLTNLSFGTYRVTATDSNGCATGILTVEITQPSAALVLAASSKTDVSCFGKSTGTVTAGVVTNSVGTVTYTWKNASNVTVGTTALVSNLPAGTYTLTVTDSCSSQTNSVTITQPSAALALAASSKTDVICFGASTGTVTAGTVSNSVGTVTYTWKNASNVTVGTTASVSNLPAGTYTLTVSDNCSSQSNSVTITQPSAALALAASSKTDVTCFGASTGSVTAGVVTNSVGTLTYTWKNASNTTVGTTASVSNLPAGTYTLNVTDSCSSQSNSVIITQPSAALALAASSKTDVICYSASTGTVTAGTVTNSVGTVTYSWKNASNVTVGTTASVSNLPAGTYTLTVSDNCSSQTNSVTITQPSAALALAASSKTDVTCYSASTGTVTAGVVTNSVGTVTYSWTNSSNAVVGNTASVSNLPAGTYTLTVSDDCSSQSNSVTITQPSAALALSVSSKTDVSCFGESTGTVTAGTVTNSVGTVIYSWTNGSNTIVGSTASVSNLPAGTYTLTVSDDCSSQSNSVTITQPSAALALAASSKTDVTCYSASTGTVTAGAVTNSVGTVTYTWINSSNAVVGNTASVSNLPAGTYTLTVSDNCSSQTNSVTITQPSAALALAASSKTDVTCYSASTGTVTAGAVTNSVGTVTYTWINSSNAVVGNTASVSNLPAGTYTLTVSDNCSSQSNSVTITQPSAALALSASSKTDASCFGESTGTVTSGTVTNAVGAITYSWTNSSNTVVGNTASVPNLPAGTYTLTVSDDCSSQSNSVTISQPGAALTCSITQNKAVTANGLSNGEATVTPIGGNGNYTYLWDNNETTQKAIGLNAGLHTVTVTDEKGCTTTCSITITEPNVLSCSITQDSAVKCFGESNGQATVTAIGGNGDYTYLWDNNETTALAVSLNAGLHTVTVTDKLGYTTTCSVTITQPQEALSATTTQVDVVCGGGNTGSATVFATGGTSPYTYSWNTNPAQTTTTATTLAAGNYSVIVTDANLCTVTKSVTIIDGDSVKPIIDPLPETSTINCPAEPVFEQATATDDIGTIASLTYEDAIVPGNCTGSYTKTRTWTATDSCGNVSLPVSQTIIVQDITAPTWTTQAGSLNQTIECSNAEALATAQTLFPIASDLCDTDVSNITKVSGQFIASEGCANSGTYTNTWTVKDDCGNTSDTFTQIITIQDTTAPAWTTQAGSLNQTIECSNAEALTSAQALFPTASDLCDTDVSNITKVSGQFIASEGCANSGTYTNTWTVKDDCGNTSDTFTQIITIQDTTAPTWTTQAGSLNQTIECSNAEALISAQALFPTASDLCDIDVSNVTKVSGQFVASEGCANAGTYTNTWTVKDDCGNTSDTFTQIITIQDTTAPTWTTQSGSLNQTIECSNAEALTSAQALFPTASDLCDADVSNITKVSGQFVASEGCSNSGTYTNTWTVKDDCGNTSDTFTQIITIQDTTAPTWTTQAGSLNQTIECSNQEALTSAQALFPTASDLCDADVSNITKVSGQFIASEGCANAGTYTNTWTVKDDCGNTSDTFTQIITIQDTTAPTWTTQAGSLNQTIECSNAEALATAQTLFPAASDLCDADVSNITKVSGQFVASEGCANSGTYTNTWTVKDDCGNTSDTFTQIITIQDTTTPTWATQAGSLNQTIECSNAEALTSAQALFPTASDSCDTDVSNITKVSGQFVASEGCSNSGTYTNTWTVKDDCGNTSDTFTQIITIQDTTAPTWATQSGSLNQTIECSNQEALASAQALFPTASDLCDVDVSNITKVSGQFIASEGCANSGTYTNTWTVKDDCGNISDTFTQIITIQDTTAPTWATQAGSLNQTIECSNAEALNSAQALFPTASDLCDTDVSNITKVSGQFLASEGCGNSGTYTNTWTVKDDCENTSDTFTQIITIQDTTAPIWTTQAGSLNQTIECNNAEALNSAQALFPTASDLCDADVSNITKVSGQFIASERCGNSGTYTNTWTVKDDCGNTSDTFTQVITIQDTTAPTWTTQTGSLNQTIECSNAEALTSAQALFPSASDLCDTDVSNITKVSGQFVASEGCGNSGTYTNTWTVKDDCGNTSDTFTQVITIQDTTAPTWTTQTGSLNQTIECSNAEALTSAQALFPSASDLCDADVSNITKVSEQFVASEGCGNSGTYTNTWTVKDDCGNTSDTFTQIITIQDTTAPTWATQAESLNQTIECSNAEALTSAQALFPSASDLCDADVSNITKVSGHFVASEGCSNAGTYTNSWIAKDDCGNVTDSFIQIITIEDTTPPTFTGNLPTDITVSCDAVPEPANLEASDNCSGDLPIVFSEIKSNVLNECGTDYTLTRKWTTSDCGGNTVSHTQIITVRDTTPPTGTAPADVADLQSIIDIPAPNPQAIIDAVDNCSSTVTITISDSNNGGSGCNGNAYILTKTYTLTDCAGNKTELVQTFTVENKVSVTGVATNVTCFGKSDGSILVTNSPGSTVVITNDQNEVVGNTNLPAGTYTLTATSAVNGENQTCTATATVVITQPEYSTKISGYVMNVDNNSGIANVMVTLIPQGTTTGPILLRITGTDGGYSFTGMSAGSYLVQVQDATLNSVYQLYPTDSSLFFTVLEDCTFQEHTFNYGSSTLPVLGDYVWYDVNSNGIQDEWYDANNDGVVTKNVPDSGGGIDYSLWEWIDFNGDGSYQGPSNVGELNAGGFGNAASPNVIIDGPNGYHKEVIIGIEGYWRDRPNTENPYGAYIIKLVKDANLDAMAAALGATGLVKLLPNLADKKATAKTGKIEMHTVCSTTSPSSYIVNVTSQDLVHLDNDFGINCKEYRDIVANDDSAGPIAGVNHTTTNVLNVLVNDTLEGNAVTVSDVIITTVTPNEFLQLNPDGSVDVLPNAPVGTLTLVYQICEADQTSNCDTATVTITIVAPIMTVTATPICVNDVPYIDYVVTPGNFTPVNGVTIAWANAQNTVITTMTDLPLSGRVSWPGAVVNEAGNGIDWPGWIFENNKWVQGADGFESLRPTVNLKISVNPSESITVNYPPADPYCIARPTFAIVANDDNPPAITAPAGVTNIVNVYNNDTLNNDPVNPADVTLTTVTPDPTNTITLNPDGSVDVAPNSPAGTYTLTYQICENADAGNCDTAIVTVIIVEPAPPTPVVANDDVYANIGCNTFGLVGNVLSNDFKGQLPATLELVNFTLLAENENNAKTDPNITIDNQGNVTVSSLTPAGTYTYTYRICDKLSAENCDTATVTITVVPNGIVNITSESCNDDSSLINLSNLLPEGTPITGTWIDTNETNALQGNIFNPFGLALGNYTFEYKITDENCPRSVLLNMEVNNDCHVLACGNILVHNAFSPNGDGINDVFVIDSINDITCYPENTVEIYNRWGILVFETSNYNNTTNAFDGTSRGRTTVNKSDGLPSGTYFYILTYKSLNGNNEIQNNKEDGYLYLSK